LTATLLFSAALTVGFARPDRVRSAEEALGRFAPRYALLAGAREAAVSSTRSWWQRVAEYRSADVLCEELATHGPESVPVRWVLSDDYGLAAQWALACSPGPVRLVLPLDPLFAERSGSPEGMRPEQGVLILSVRTDVARLLPPGTTWERWGEIEHPLTGEPVHTGSLVLVAPRDGPAREEQGKRDE
jgi:hypothetical protein